MEDSDFRFQDMEIWRRAAAFSKELFRLADQLDARRRYRFAEQLRAAVLSITNNIAEGSGSSSTAEFANFLNMARRSTYEVANILVLLGDNLDIEKPVLERLLPELGAESRMILAFMRTLKAKRAS